MPINLQKSIHQLFFIILYQGFNKGQAFFDKIKWSKHKVDTQTGWLPNTDPKLEQVAFKQLMRNPIKETVHARIKSVCVTV